MIFANDYTLPEAFNFPVTTKRFGLVYLFNRMSHFVGYLMPKAYLLKSTIYPIAER